MLHGHRWTGQSPPWMRHRAWSGPAPDVYLPSFKLADPDKDNTFQGTFNAFLVNGDYRITFYARNINANVAVSPQTIISVTGSRSVAPGDVNNDKAVNLVDAILVLRVLTQMNQGAGITTEADVNADSRLGPHEIIYILQKIVEMR